MASPTQWTWVWVNSGSWWWTGRPGVLQSMGSQIVRHDWVTKLNWTLISLSLCCWLWSRPLFPLMKLLQRYKSGLFLRYSLTSSWCNPSGFSFFKGTLCHSSKTLFWPSILLYTRLWRVFFRDLILFWKLDFINIVSRQNFQKVKNNNVTQI